MEKNIFLHDVGNIRLVKSNLAKRLVIRIKENDGIRVSVPYSLSFKNAEDFVFQKSDWIKTNLKKMQSIEAKLSVFDENTNFKTYYNQLLIRKGNVRRAFAKQENGTLKILYPAHRDVRDVSIQNFIKKAIELLLRNEARYYLPKRVTELAQEFKFTIKNVYVKNVKTRWGSCSAVNNINLNIHLMRLPHVLIDYVILHELCHTVHKNHSKDFWALLNKITNNNARKLAKEMRDYRITSY